MTEQETRAIFLLAGIPIKTLHKIENCYWPESYVELRKAYPWWLVETGHGLVKIGWRKRVISIDWESTTVYKVVTNDEVTKGNMYVHAYSYAKAVEYMAEWYRLPSHESVCNVMIPTEETGICDCIVGKLRAEKEAAKTVR